MSERLLQNNTTLKNTLMNYPGIEFIDNIKFPSKKDKADYLFENRSVIVEQKWIQNIKEDRSKIHPELKVIDDRHGNDPITGYPMLELWSEEELELYNKFYIRKMNFFKQYFRNANGQIGDTKEVLGLDNAYGVLLLINTSPYLHPRDVRFQSEHILYEIKNDKTRYSNINAVVSLNEHQEKRTCVTFPCIRFDPENIREFPFRLIDFFQSGRVSRNFRNDPIPDNVW